MTNDHERDTNVPEAQAAEATEDRRDFVKKSLVIAGAAGAALVGAGCSDAQAAPGVPGDASPDAIKKAAAGYAEESLPTAADQVACDECRFAVDGACSRFEFPINTQAGSCEQGSPVGVRGAVELLMRYVRIHDLPTRNAADSCANCDNNVSGVCSAASLLYEALDATGEVQVDEHTSCEKLRRVTSAREHLMRAKVGTRCECYPCWCISIEPDRDANIGLRGQIRKTRNIFFKSQKRITTWV